MLRKIQKHKCSTAGILTGVGVTAACITGIIMLRNYLGQQCNADANEFQTYLDEFLNLNLTLQNFSANVQTNFPSQFPASANITIPGYPGIIPIETIIQLMLPKSTTALIGPITESMQALITTILGKPFVDYLLSVPGSAKQVCQTDTSYAVIGVGIIVSLAILWLIALTFVLGDKVYSYGKKISELEKQIKQLQARLPEESSSFKEVNIEKSASTRAIIL